MVSKARSWIDDNKPVIMWAVGLILMGIYAFYDVKGDTRAALVMAANNKVKIQEECERSKQVDDERSPQMAALKEQMINLQKSVSEFKNEVNAGQIRVDTKLDKLKDLIIEKMK